MIEWVNRAARQGGVVVGPGERSTCSRGRGVPEPESPGQYQMSYEDNLELAALNRCDRKRVA